MLQIHRVLECTVNLYHVELIDRGTLKTKFNVLGALAREESELAERITASPEQFPARMTQNSVWRVKDEQKRLECTGEKLNLV